MKGIKGSKQNPNSRNYRPCNVQYLNRILTYLRENGASTKTNIAINCSIKSHPSIINEALTFLTKNGFIEQKHNNNVIFYQICKKTPQIIKEKAESTESDEHKYGRYTKEEDKFIIDNYRNLTFEQIAKKLKRTRDSVDRRIIKLKKYGKIKKTKGYGFDYAVQLKVRISDGVYVTFDIPQELEYEQFIGLAESLRDLKIKTNWEEKNGTEKY